MDDALHEGPDTGSTLSRRTVDGLVEVARELATVSDLQRVLDVVCRAIVEVAQFESAAVNLVSEDGSLQVVAVAGPPDVGEAIMGATAGRDGWEVELARCHLHHGLYLSLGTDGFDGAATWISDDAAWFERNAGDPRAWQPEYGLFVLLRGAAEELLGIVSVDLPASGLIPDAAQCAAVEILARQAGPAIVAAGRLARSELNERIYRLAFDTAPALKCIADHDGTFVRVNQQYVDTFGTAAHGAAAFDALSTLVEGESALVGTLDAVFAGAMGDQAFVVKHGDSDSPRWLRVTVRGVVHTGPVPLRAVCSMSDISEERRASMSHQHDAEHDALTGLLNRRGGREATASLVQDVGPDDIVAALACDLDNFKAVNDLQGHPAGDEVLVEAAARLAGTVPAGSVLVRLGGDEFTVVTRCATRGQAEAVAEAVVAGMRRPVDVDGASVTVTVSVGLAVATGVRPDAVADLFGAADSALYEAKATGRDRWVCSSGQVGSASVGGAGRPDLA